MSRSDLVRWHDGRTDPKERAKHHFGTVLNAYPCRPQPGLRPKLAYLAARALTAQLRGYASIRPRLRRPARPRAALHAWPGRARRRVEQTANPHAITVPAARRVPGRRVDRRTAAAASRRRTGLAHSTDRPRRSNLTTAKPNDALASHGVGTCTVGSSAPMADGAHLQPRPQPLRSRCA